MFQYAAGKAAATKLGTDLKIDLEWFTNLPPSDTPRSFELNQFNITASIAKEKEIGGARAKGFQTLARLIRTKVFRHFDDPLPSRAKSRESLYLEGFWQNEKYFQNIGDIIKKEFTLRSPFTSGAENMLKEIQTKDAVSLHIRRGDYVSDTKTKQHHGTCSPDYYKKAIKLIKEKLPNPHFFIFSDDKKSAENMLGLNSDITYVSGEAKIGDAEEIILMSLCKHNIIANSSFSFWGAWLNQNLHKIVIAPTQWTSSKKADNVIPRNWIQIQNI